jgi:hypothetical protein
MEIIKVSHSILLSHSLKKVFFEKNARYNGKITLFWWKINSWEDEITAIIRELKEETWNEFSKIDFINFLNNDKLLLDWILYIWMVSILILTNYQINKLLSFSQNNIWLDIDSLEKWNFAFEDTINKVRNAVEKIKRETL